MSRTKLKLKPDFKSHRTVVNGNGGKRARRLAPPSQQVKEADQNILPTYRNRYENQFEPVPITFYYVVFPQNESQNESRTGTHVNTEPRPFPHV
ncbi:unnamed protein product [Kluyveromyces dobzhanskii CBS 2104]|uniref:WGS project CCBQ000000000 data, contig 00058 n=1 Tax=Kluyveromyces dobzhanskii CBS 2104 TaxID=1427455 RepID=A0A0A8LD83_9SACH|nr:unnamed protein product [Kluyveromyces dobzhanskii CBS 2104]